MNTVIYNKSNGEIMIHKVDQSLSANSIEILHAYLIDNEVSSDDFGIVEISNSEWLNPTQWSDKMIDVNTGKIIVNPNFSSGPTLAIRTIPFTDISILK
jgi:hypothetical protein